MYAPIALFAYCRLHHTRKTVESLLLNLESKESDLIIFSDGPKSPNQRQSVEDVRQYLRSITGFNSISIIERTENYGLAKSIIDGVTKVLSSYENIIVLEDDLVLSKYFLKFMNESLLKYENYKNVASIHGYVYPVESKLPETFFLRGADCWGWSTWRRAWKTFNPDGAYLLSELNKKKLLNHFDFNGSYSFSNMLKEQVLGKNQSWAIRWHASTYLDNMLTLYPGRSLVINIGHDSTGTHSGETKKFDTKISETPIQLIDTPVKPSKEGFKAFEEYFKKEKNLTDTPLVEKILKFVNRLVHDVLPPIIIRILKKNRALKATIQQNQKSKNNIYFEGNFENWNEASKICDGYDQSNILSKVLESARKVVAGEAVYERDSVIFDNVQYSWPVLAALLWTAAKNNGQLVVLDYGGSLGSSYFQNKRFINELSFVSWNVVEQKHYAEAGRKHINIPNLYFFDNIDICLNQIMPNVVLLSSVLQYLENPLDTLKTLTVNKPDTVILDRTAFTKDGLSQTIKIQHVPSQIYEATYPCWYMSEALIIQTMQNEGYELIESFDSLDNLDDSACWKGHIYKRVLNE